MLNLLCSVAYSLPNCGQKLRYFHEVPVTVGEGVEGEVSVHCFPLLSLPPPPKDEEH